jgi:hypothetical protein
MIKPISFCINTANNEKDYILLLLKSLSDNTQIDIHEILVFIDSDNQNTYEELLNLKTTIPSLKVWIKDWLKKKSQLLMMVQQLSNLTMKTLVFGYYLEKMEHVYILLKT